MKRIVITGASGFVGMELAATLSGFSLRLATRRNYAAALADTEFVTVGEIDANTHWDPVLRDTYAVIHLAAHVHVMKATAADSERFHRTNVLGTARLAEAAARNGVERFIFLSSIKVNGESTAVTPFGPHDAPHPVDDYGISKWRAEERLFEIAARERMSVACIRPPLVYGPGVRANFLRLMQWIDRGKLLPVGRPENRRSMVSIWNLCDLIKTLLVAPSFPANVFLVSDGADLSTADLIRGLAKALNRRARLLEIPVPVFKALGTMLGRGGEVTRLCESLTVDIAETRQLLNWNPPVSIEEGLRRTATWYSAACTHTQ